MRQVDISPDCPDTADSPLRRALLAGIQKFQPPKRREGARQCSVERKVRSGEMHAARGLDVVYQACRRHGAPYYGPSGFQQILQRVDFRARLDYGLVPNVRDLHRLSVSETLAQVQVDLYQAQRLERLNEGELDDLAAHCETHAEALKDFALAARTRAHELSCGALSLARVS